MNIVNATKFFTLKWPILCYINFISMKKNVFKRIKERTNMVKAFVNRNHLVTGVRAHSDTY